MSLTEIEYGSLASSETMNNNFEYLDNKITDVSESLISTAATINSNIATINSTVSTLGTNTNSSIDTINGKINSINSALSGNGIYITTYKNGSSWYREYFSNPEKTNRVWLEQGFFTPVQTWADNDCKTYNLVKPFVYNNYTVVATSTTMYVGSGVSSGNVAVEWTSTTQIGIGNDARNTFGVRVYACGV